MHKLASGSYRHRGVTIERSEEPASTGWRVRYAVAGVEFNTLAGARHYIERRAAKGLGAPEGGGR